MANPTTPTQEQPGSGIPMVKVPLPDDLMDRIRAQATSTAPKEQVKQSTQEPAPEKGKEPVEAKKDATPAKAEPAKMEAKPEAKTPEPPPATPPAKKDGITQVREALERAEARVRDLEGNFQSTAKEKADAYTKVAELEKKLGLYEERIAKEFEPQVKRLSEVEKKLQEREEALRLRDYTATPDWHERYVKPIVDVQQEVQAVLAELAVVDAEGNARAATPEDFAKIHSAASLNAAENLAKQLFGEGFATTELVRHSSRLRSLSRIQQEALKKAQLESAEYFKKREETQLAEQARFKQTVEQRVANYITKPAEGDAEEAAAFAEGQRFAEQLERGSQDPETWADMVARVKATTANEKLKDLRLKRISEENAALKAELAKYQGSEPRVEASGKGAPDSEDSGEEVSGLRAHLLSRARAIASGKA